MDWIPFDARCPTCAKPPVRMAVQRGYLMRCRHEHVFAPGDVLPGLQGWRAYDLRCPHCFEQATERAIGSRVALLKCKGGHTFEPGEVTPAEASSDPRPPFDRRTVLR